MKKAPLIRVRGTTYQRSAPQTPHPAAPVYSRFTPARSSFARPGPAVDPKVRSVRRSDGSTEFWPRHRPSPRRRELSRATFSRGCSQTSIFLLQLHRPSPPQGACATHSTSARNGTSNSGRNPWARHRPLAHQNAPSRGLHGPRVPCPRTQP